MNADQWLTAFAQELGIDPPDEEASGQLLDLAATAAHSSERIAAPLACYMTGRSGKSPQQAREAAERVGAA
jgi:Domain of unknown function (DUF6457)